MTTPPPFLDAARDFDPTIFAAGAAAAEAQRESIITQFPRSDWPALPLERYALGQGDVDTFCRWVEFRSDDLGSISGGSAQKLLISRNAKTGTWRYPDRYGSVEQAWADVRAGFLKAFELADQDKWEPISAIEALKGAGALRTKALHVYFPDQVLPVYSKSHLEHYYKLVTGKDAEGARLRTNRAILAALRQQPRLAELSTYFLGRFLYSWADPREQVRIVKIAPGEGAKFWGDCRTGEYICVGWDEIGDLRQFEDKSDFRAAFEEIYRNVYATKAKRSEKANEVWTLRELEPGDVVIANEGTSRVLAIGQVVDPGYQWSDRELYRHIVHVKWDTSYDQDLPTPVKSWATRTVAKVPAELYQQIVTGAGGNKSKSGPGTVVVRLPPIVIDPFLGEIGAALERKGQVILYGPPGTGKTYTARRFAVDFLLEAEQRPDRAEVLGDRVRFEAEERRLSTAWSGESGSGVGPLTHLTFHPSYSYEDFVEGFRPIDTGASGLSLSLQDGVFKRICQVALARPKQRFLVLIDEINRANLAKVMGELITVIERDKRGLSVMLPQSRQRLAVPPNVYILGTMNTADRSIKLMDAALRRRFAFIECLPDLKPLEGVVIDGLALDELLGELNRRIIKREGREKQIGQSFLMEAGKPIGDAGELARRFRYEILPLLQEYCYGNYGALAEYLGKSLVDVDGQRLDEDTLERPESLIAALDKALFGQAAESE